MKGTGRTLYELNMAGYTSNARIRYKFISNGNVFIDSGFTAFAKRTGRFNFTGINGPYIDVEITTKGAIHWNMYIACPWS